MFKISDMNKNNVVDLSGSIMKSLVNQNYLIVSCADCSPSRIFIFDHKLQSVN